MLKRSSLGTSDIQDCCYPKGITYLIIIHEGDPIPCKTTYIEYRSPVKMFIIFFRMPPNSIGLHCKIVLFFIVLRRRSWGAPLGELEKLIFFKQYEKKLIISEDLFLVETFKFRNFRHPGVLLPKGNYVYDIYIYRYIPFYFYMKRPNSLQKHIHRI